MIVRATVVVCVRLPEVPVIVTVAGPTVAVLDAVNVTRLLPIVVLGLNDAVTPPGSPLAVRATALLNPPMSVTVTVLVPLKP